MPIPNALLAMIADPTGGNNALSMYGAGMQQGQQNRRAAMEERRYNALIEAEDRARTLEEQRLAYAHGLINPQPYGGPRGPVGGDGMPRTMRPQPPRPPAAGGGLAQAHLAMGNPEKAVEAHFEGGGRPATAQEKAQWGVPADAPLWFDGKGQPHLLSGGTDIDIDMRGDSAFATEGAKVLAQDFGEIYKQGRNAKAMLGDLNFLKDISSRITTGQSAEFSRMIGPLAQMAGVEIEGLGDMQAYQAVVSKMVPRMRPPGSGPASDFDAQQFLLSLPALRNTPEGNQLIDITFRSLAAVQMEAARIAGMALSGQMDYHQAQNAISELPDPYTAFKQAVGNNAPAAGANSSAPKSPADMSDEELLRALGR